jgi:hypothetical protein
MFSTFGFTLGLVPNVELDLGPVVCMMTAGERQNITAYMENNIHRCVISL